MTRPKSQWWDYVTKVKSNKWQCKFCDVIYLGNLTEVVQLRLLSCTIYTNQTTNANNNQPTIATTSYNNPPTTTNNQNTELYLGMDALDKFLQSDVEDPLDINQSAVNNQALTAFKQSAANNQTLIAFNQSAANNQALTAFNQSATNNQALTAFNQSAANNQALTAFNQSAANNQALTAFKQSAANNQTLIAFNQSAANNQALTAFNQSATNNQALTAFNQSVANNQVLTAGDFDNKVVGCELKALETLTALIEEENNKLKRDKEQLDLRKNRLNHQVAKALHRLQTLNHNPEANKNHSEIAVLMDQLKGYK